MLKKVDNFFGITKLGSSFKIELLAGLSTFLALSYIFVVNPAVLSAAGISTSAVFFATVIGSVVTTLLMGLWARLPFAVAPGLEMNAYIAYVVVGVLGFAWQGALGAVFWSGVLTVILSYTPLRVNIVKAIPDKLKSGLAASVGMFLLLVALKVSGILVYQGVNVQGFGLLASKEAVIFYIGLALVLLLRALKMKGAVILSIIGSAIVAHFMGLTQGIPPITFSKAMFSGIFALNLGIIFNPKVWSVIIVLFVLDFYGSIAKFIGLAGHTSLVDAGGNVPRIKEGLIVDGMGTVIGAATGTSNLITFVESAAGIGEGGRTGLVAVTVAVLMSLFLFLTPLINLVPVVATTGALFFVGLTLFPTKKNLSSYTWVDMVSVALMVLVTAWTFGLTQAMLAGFAAFTILLLVQGKWRDVNWYLIGTVVVLLAGFLLSQ